MTPPQFGASVYWLGIVLWTVGYEAFAVSRWGLRGTISHVTMRAGEHCPWLPWLIMTAAVFIAYHLILGWWPFIRD